MTFYCLIWQEMLNFVTNCCKLLKVNQAAERAVSSTVFGDNLKIIFVISLTKTMLWVLIRIALPRRF